MFMFFNRPLLYVSTEDEAKAGEAKEEILKKRKDETGIYGLKKKKGKSRMINVVIICVVVTSMATLYWVLYGKGINR